METEYIDLSDNELDRYDDISDILKDLFIDECIYESMDFIINLKDYLPYFTKSSTKNIISNLQHYLKNKKINKNIIKYRIEDEDVLLYVFNYINNVIKNNKKLYSIKENYDLTLNDFIYFFN